MQESHEDRRDPTRPRQAPGPRSWRSVPGWSAIGLSTLLWVALPAIPFLPLSLGAKASTAAAALVVAEVLFWIGLLLVGPTVAGRIRGWLRRPSPRPSAGPPRASSAGPAAGRPRGDLERPAGG
jgi:hypothetical protein